MPSDRLSVSVPLSISPDLAVGRAGHPAANDASVVQGQAPPAIIRDSANPQVDSIPSLTGQAVQIEAAPPPRLFVNQASPEEPTQARDSLNPGVAELRKVTNELLAQIGRWREEAVGEETKALAGARGGVSLATTREYGALLALRDAAKVKPTRTVPPPVANESAPAAQADAAAQAPAAPQNAAEDHTEAKLLKLDLGASAIEGFADVYMMLNGLPDSTGSLGAEFVGSLVGLLPELVTLSSRIKERSAGEAIGREATRMLNTVDSLTNEAAKLKLKPITPSQISLVENVLSDLKRIRTGLDLTVEYADRVVHETRDEIKSIGLATAGRVAELGGNVATILGEAGVMGTHAGHVLAGVGAGVMGAAGLVTLPFQARMLAGAINRAQGDERRGKQAEKVLSEAAKRVERARSDESSGVRRGLARFVQRSSAPRENRFKAFLFGLGITSTVAGATTSGLMAAAAAGAAVGGAIAAVGLLASGLGLLGVGLLGGYFIYKAVSKDRSYSMAEIKDVVAGKMESPLMRELGGRQITKVRNQLSAEMIRQSLKHDPALVPLLARAVEHYEKLDTKAFSISNREFAEAVRTRLDSLNLPENLARRLTGSLTRELVAELAAGAWVGKLNQPDLKIDDEIAARFESRVNTQLTALLHEVDKQRTPLQSAEQWGSAMVPLLREGSPTRDGLLKRLCTELPASDDLRVGQLVDAALQRGAGQAGARTLDGLLNESAPELARMSAMRKLVRRDPEALFYTCVDTLKSTDEKSGEHQRLRDDLIAFGVKPETLDMAIDAQTLEQMVQAAGLLARDLEGR